MKALEELYGEILKSEELNKAFAEALRGNKVEDFLKANGCEAGMEELAAFLGERGREAKAVELADEELDNVAGGIDLSMFGEMVCPRCHSRFITVSTLSDFEKKGCCRNCGYDWIYHDWIYTVL